MGVVRLSLCLCLFGSFGGKVGSLWWIVMVLDLTLLQVLNVFLLVSEK